jgi:hypothetical protein
MKLLASLLFIFCLLVLAATIIAPQVGKRELSDDLFHFFVLLCGAWAMVLLGGWVVSYVV